jgi:hypothetical protein
MVFRSHWKFIHVYVSMCCPREPGVNRFFISSREDHVLSVSVRLSWGIRHSQPDAAKLACFANMS